MTPLRRSALVVFTLAFVYIGSITLLRHTPWLHIGPDFSGAMSMLWALAALGGGFAARRPAYILTGFLAACMAPHHRTIIAVAFLTGAAMLARVLWQHRSNLRAFISDAIRQRGFGYVLAVSGYIAALWLLRLGDSTDAWSLFALGASMLTVPFAVYSLSYLPWPDEETRLATACISALFAALVAVVLLYPALVGQYDQYGMGVYTIYKAVVAYLPLPFTVQWVNPDFNTASLRSAHYMSILAGLFAFACFAFAFRAPKKGGAVAMGLAALFAAGMGENGHALPGVLAATALLGAALLLRAMLRPGMLAGLLLGATALFTVLLVFAVYEWTPYFSRMPKAAFYRASARYAMAHPGRLLLGEGPAAFASHAARKRLPASLTDELDFPFLPRFVNPAYAAVLRAADGPDKYTTLNRPISGLAGLVMEWGLTGSALLAALFWRLLRNALHTAGRMMDAPSFAMAITAVAGFILLFVSLVFRPYFEYPEIMAAVSVLFLLSIMRPAAGRMVPA